MYIVYPDNVEGATADLPADQNVDWEPALIEQEASTWEKNKAIIDDMGLHAKTSHQWYVKGAPVNVYVKHFPDTPTEWELVGQYTDETAALILDGVLGFRFHAVGGTAKVRLISK